MPKTYSLSDTAQLDYEEILEYIGNDNPFAARKVSTQFKTAFDQLADHPYMGHKREDLTLKPLRFWPVGNYLVIYDPNASPLQIIRILSGYRDAIYRVDDI